MILFDNISRKNTCAFTGPRPEKLDISESFLFENIVKEIKLLHLQGYTHFLSGMSRGFDLISALAVLSLEDELGIELICIVPYVDQCKAWSFDDKKVYNDILSRARHTICMSDTYFNTVFFARNRLLVDNSSKILTYYNKTKGGTKYTLDYANSKNVDIINISTASLQASFF